MTNNKVEIFKKDLENALVDESINSILIRGYDDDLKIRETIRVLNNNYTNGVIIGAKINDSSQVINEAFDKKILKRESKYLGNMQIRFDKYESQSDGINAAGEFALFVPVQTIFLIDKERFLEHFSNTVAKKKIIITYNDMNDVGKEISSCSGSFDKVIVCDCSESNPGLIETMNSNNVYFPY